MNVILESSWKAALLKEFSKSYFKELTNFVRHSYQTSKVYPPASLIFNALDSCPLTNTSVVILGQDPYHGPSSYSKRARLFLILTCFCMGQR